MILTSSTAYLNPQIQKNGSGKQEISFLQKEKPNYIIEKFVILSDIVIATNAALFNIWVSHHSLIFFETTLSLILGIFEHNFLGGVQCFIENTHFEFRF